MKTLKLFTFAMAMAFSTATFADYDLDLRGEIISVDDANKTITIKGNSNEPLVIKVLPYTKIKGDDCGRFGRDIYGTFKDLTLGQFVEVEAYPQDLSAKKIEWKCGGRKAY